MGVATTGTLASVGIVIGLLALALATHRIALLKDRRKDAWCWGDGLKWFGYILVLTGGGLTLASWWQPLWPREWGQLGIAVAVGGISTAVWGHTLREEDRHSFAQWLRLPMSVALVACFVLFLVVLSRTC